MGRGDEQVYDVALSYASEQRYYVDAVRRSLNDRSVKTFYAPDRQSQLWGKDGVEVFHETYFKLAFAVVMFISGDYVAKQWPTVERRAMLGRMLRDPMDHHILPVRFDDVDVPGMPAQIIYQNAADYRPDELADLIVETLHQWGRVPASIGEQDVTARTEARRVGFTSNAIAIGSNEDARYTIHYRIVNSSASSLIDVVVAIPDYHRHADASPDDQYGCALDIVVPGVGIGEVIEDDVEVVLGGSIPFSNLPYAATLLWSDLRGNHWSLCGPDLHRRVSPARTC